MDTYWGLLSDAIKHGNLEELYCLLTGYKNESPAVWKEDTIPHISYFHLPIPEKKGLFSKDMCFISMCPVINQYDDKEGTTLLHQAVSQYPYSPEAVWLLLQHGANPNAFDKSGASTLHVTLFYLEGQCGVKHSDYLDKLDWFKLKDIIYLLIEFKADLYNLTPDGLSFLHVLVSMQYVFEELFENFVLHTHFNINYQIPDTIINHCMVSEVPYDVGDTALHIVSKAGFYTFAYNSGQICKVLLQFGIDPDIRDRAGCTALHYSVGDYELMKALLEAGCDPNMQIINNSWKGGFMALHIAFNPFYMYDMNSVRLSDFKLLLQNGGCLDIVDYNNISPMVYYYNLIYLIPFKPGIINIYDNIIINRYMNIFQVLMSGGAVSMRALKEVLSLDKYSRQNFEYMIIGFYSHTWIFKTLLDIRYPFLFLKTTSEHYQLYSIPQSLKRLSAMVLYSSLKPNVWCGIKKLQIPTSIRDYVTLGSIDILFSDTCEAIYNDEHVQITKLNKRK